MQIHTFLLQQSLTLQKLLQNGEQEQQYQY